MKVENGPEDDQDFVDGDFDWICLPRGNVEVESESCEDACFESEREIV